MAQQEEISSDNTESVSGSTPLQEAPSTRPSQQQPKTLHNKAEAHNCQASTFLAWIRTSLAIMGFGFVVERFGLLLREIGTKITNVPIPNHYSALVGITLTVLGVVVMAVALLNFLQARKAIDKGVFHSCSGFAIFMTVRI